ncbi:MAG: 16S rRNA (cytidine(1402)-2'-O)-methyltransferase [Patescibacteria group bacterium]
MFTIVATPIGNMDDLSLRQAKTIAYADIILTEDTRSTGILLDQIEKKFGYKKNDSQKLVSYYKEKEFEKLAYVLELIDKYEHIVLISESGMPLISDPGEQLVHMLVKKNIKFTVVPGPSAGITALIHSGFKLDKYAFFGFMPKKKSEAEKALRQAIQISKDLKQSPVVFYDSPKRIRETLMVLDEIDPNTDICICRELTKKFEEIIRGKPHDLITRDYKGEIVFILKASV